MKILTVSAVVGLLCVAGLPPDDAAAQSEMDQMSQRILAKIQSYSANPDISKLGALTGLWTLDSGESNPTLGSVRAIMHVGDALLYYIVDVRTGELGIGGMAENTAQGWQGWWSLACRNCCPGVGWWDRGAFLPRPGVGALIDIHSKKMDPNTCKLTSEPDVIDLNLKLVQALKFKEIAPGKLIHITAAPAVGNQAAQYKAAVVLQWNLQNLGVSYFTIVTAGKRVVERGTNLAGEYQFVTDRSGRNQFMLVAYNTKDQPLHFEIRSIDIPPIPGIGR